MASKKQRKWYRIFCGVYIAMLCVVLVLGTTFESFQPLLTVVANWANVVLVAGVVVFCFVAEKDAPKWLWGLNLALGIAALAVLVLANLGVVAFGALAVIAVLCIILGVVQLFYHL